MEAPPGGGSTSTVSQFSSRLVDVSCAAITDPEPERNCEVPGSTGEINSQGFWKVTTSVPSGSGPYYAICLDAVEAPEDPDGDPLVLPHPLEIKTLSLGDLALDADGTINADGEGEWRGLSFQIWDGSACSGNLLRESGLSLRSELEVGEEASTFTSPFVALNCGTNSCMSPGEVADSYGLINNNGDWVVLTGGLIRGTKYKVCLNAVEAAKDPDTGMPLVDLPFRLASRSAQKKGTFFASGNMVERYEFQGHWVGLSLEIYEEGGTDTCDGVFVQETGINIVVPPP